MNRPLRVRLKHEPTTPQLHILSEGLGPEVVLEPDAEAPVDVLVTGRPTAEELSLVRQALVVPYSGLPASTRTLLLEQAPELPVFNLHHNAEAVAEVAVGLALAASKCIVSMDRRFRELDWRARYEPDPALPLAGGRALILGFGAIGRRIRPALDGLQMEVHAIRRLPSPDDPSWVHGPESLDRLLPELRLLVLALPHTPDTDRLMDTRRLGLLPRTCSLVNVGRGAVVDEEALFHALSEGRLHSAGLDVWTHYPRSEAERVGTAPSDWPFQELDNVVLSPHRAGHGPHVEAARFRDLAHLLTALARGEAPAPVDVIRGY